MGRQCHRCGELSPPDAAFCGSCGTKLAANDELAALVESAGPSWSSDDDTATPPRGTPTDRGDEVDIAPPVADAAPPPAATTAMAATPDATAAMPVASPVYPASAPAAAATAAIPERRRRRAGGVVIAAAFLMAVAMIGVGIWLIVNATGSDDDTARVVDGDAATPVTEVSPDEPDPATPDAAPSTTVGPGATDLDSPDTSPTDTVPSEDTGPDTTVPDTTVPDTTVPDTTVPDTTVPDTTGPDATVPDTTVAPDPSSPDLGLSAPMLEVTCNGGYVTFVGSAVGNQPYANVVSSLLEAYPGSGYLWTKSCPSLRQEFTDGSDIYGVVFGPFDTQAAACAAISDGPADAYVRRLSTTDPANHTIDC